MSFLRLSVGSGGCEEQCSFCRPRAELLHQFVPELDFISFSYLHYQGSGRQILRYLRTVAASCEHRRVVVHVRHVDDNRGDVIEGRLAATSLEREVVLPGNFKVQRRDEDQKACKTTGVKTELFF